ncbi:hypothetical protein QZH41_010665 [Actinostola sp. cb2023]|nr:hypothetical protein QZH41_010665 [Actinostola sp. cb2023]
MYKVSLLNILLSVLNPGLQQIFEFRCSPLQTLLEDLQNARTQYQEANMNREELEDAIERIQSHFRCLFNHMLRSMPLGILEEELNVVDTKFGKITLTDDGQVLIDPGVWERMSAELKKLDGIREDDFEQLVARFQMALYNHYAQQGHQLYHISVMRAFAEQNAPGLFDMLLHSITRDDTRLLKARRETQEQRTVALLHILAYFRSQKTNQLQRDCGIFLAQHGLSRNGQAAGVIFGDSVHRRTIDYEREKMAKEHYCNVDNQIGKAVTMPRPLTKSGKPKGQLEYFLAKF